MMMIIMIRLIVVLPFLYTTTATTNFNSFIKWRNIVPVVHATAFGLHHQQQRLYPRYHVRNNNNNNNCNNRWERNAVVGYREQHKQRRMMLMILSPQVVRPDTVVVVVNQQRRLHMARDSRMKKNSLLLHGTTRRGDDSSSGEYHDDAITNRSGATMSTGSGNDIDDDMVVDRSSSSSAVSKPILASTTTTNTASTTSKVLPLSSSSGGNSSTKKNNSINSSQMLLQTQQQQIIVSASSPSSSSSSSSNSVLNIVKPLQSYLDTISDGWILSYANLYPDTPQTQHGQLFLLTNLCYTYIGYIAVQDYHNIPFGVLCEVVSLLSFNYHYEQLRNVDRNTVRLSLLCDYIGAFATIMFGLYYVIFEPLSLYLSSPSSTLIQQGVLLSSTEMSTTTAVLVELQSLQLQCIITGIVSMLFLLSCWIYEAGKPYMTLHGLWHISSAYTGYLIGTYHYHFTTMVMMTTAAASTTIST